MKQFLLICGAVASMACAPASPAVQPATPASSTSADRSEVIAAVESIFSAMRTRDTAAIRAALLPNAQLVSIRPVAGAAPRIQVTPGSAWIASVGRATEVLDERMWSPRVEVAGDMASLWAPYDFRVGSAFSHCGHDAVQLARTNEGWKVTAITYTVITAGCTAP